MEAAHANFNDSRISRLTFDDDGISRPEDLAIDRARGWQHGNQ